MKSRSNLRLLVSFTLLVALIVGFSLLSTSLWSAKAEEIPEIPKVVVKEGMTVGELGLELGIEKPVLREVFELKGMEELGRRVQSFNLSRDEIQARLDNAVVIAAEESSKSWVHITIKFILWFAFMGFAFVLLKKKAITPRRRKALYLSAIVIFGVIMGSDPGPMGTLKDAIALYGETGVIFPPRMIAMVIFLFTVVVANKFICSWGCQAGALQDLIFRLNRDGKDKKGLIPQVKIPFALSNAIRIGFFTLFTAIAFGWGIDIIHPIDPFKIFKPLALTSVGIGFIGALLIASLFVYRPWCHLFCPFGLVGWLLEKVALFKIHVDYDKCIACGACEKACPSTVMGTILKRERVVADCFSCATCIDICPTDAISFSSGKRPRPPKDKFSDDTP